MTKHNSRLSRRTALAGLGAATLLPSRALCAASHRLKLGEFELTVLSDGHLTVPTRFLARNASEAEIASAIGVSTATVMPPCNVTLVRTPSETILIDVGSGPHYMPGAGKLAENMEAAGIDRHSISKVVFSHAHPDHLWGLLDDFDDTPMFPNASFLISAAELNFWSAQDAISRLPEDRQNFAAGARRNLERIKGKLETMKPGQEIAAGIQVLDTSGHTAGHICVELSSGRESVVVLSDALTHPIISFAHPDWMPAADHHDPQRAAAVRKTLLDKLATDRQCVIGFHLPFPGIGFVERSGSSYRFVPA
jgi:glyoxylase-like metal-dependent hydrolase (beta-lactamase superfamily II)